MEKILYFDCQSGISGDMSVAALLDLGVDRQALQTLLETLNIDGYRLEITSKQVHGIKGTDFNVILDSEHHHGHHHHAPHRNLDDIVKIINQSKIPEKAKLMSREIFEIVAVAEAKVHDKPVDQIHFHEVGAVDSIVDIVGVSICMTLLEVDKVFASPLHLGSGFVKCAHGTLPVPAPATAEILKGIPAYATDLKGELVTPTGAAIIKVLASDFIPQPLMKIEKIGYGTGKKEFGILNALRVFFGEMVSSDLKREKLVVLETNIDDMNPEIYSYLVPLLLEKGAHDVYLTNILMKKGRPGVQINVLCKEGSVAEFEQILFSETTTLGIRKSVTDRVCLDRKIVTLETPYGKIKVKAAYLEGTFFKAVPEYEECKKLAQEKGMSIKNAYQVISREIADYPF